MNDVEIVSLTPEEADLSAGAIVDVYRTAFGTPPYLVREDEVQRFATDSLPRHLRRDGFRCLVARSRMGGSILGFAYGYTGGPGQWWYEQIAGPMRGKGFEWWLQDYFELVELAVRPEAQGYGLGGALHDALLDGLSHRASLLSTHQTDTPGMRLYLKRGWVPLLENFYFYGTPMPFAVMGLDLAAAGGRRVLPGGESK